MLHHPDPSLTDLDVKVTDLRFFIFIEMFISHQSFMFTEMFISHQSVIRKHSYFKHKNIEGSASVTTDPRVHAVGWGWRSKYRTSSYSSDCELDLSFVTRILVVLIRRDSGEQRCPATALIKLVLFHPALRSPTLDRGS